MSGGLYPVDGSKIFIGSKITVGKDDLTAASFASQVFTEIDGWVNAGALGDTQEVISQGVLNRGRVVKMKGTKDAGTMENQFLIIGSDPGQKKLIAAQENQCDNFAFKVEWGSTCAPEDTVTFTGTSGTVDTEVNWVGHGLENGSPVVFSVSAGGSLPTGITADAPYYVVSADADKFKIAATVGGTAIQASTAGTGTFTATSANARGTSYFAGLVTSAQRQGGGNNTTQLQTFSIAVNSNIVDV